MKFREDYKLIFPLNPDILIVPECEDIQKINLDLFSNTVTDSYWIGDNKSKGLGIFTFNGFKVKLYQNYNDKYKYILPLIVSNQKDTYNLIGCWTKKVEGGLEYVQNLGFSLEEYDSFLNHDKVIICGDLNSNQIWDKSSEYPNHTDVVEILSKKGISSSYHSFYNETHGQETIPTYFHYHQKERPFHIDYCFLSKSLIDRLKKVEIGEYYDWIKCSDHVPLIIDINS